MYIRRIMKKNYKNYIYQTTQNDENQTAEKTGGEAINVKLTVIVSILVAFMMIISCAAISHVYYNSLKFFIDFEDLTI